MTVSIDGTSGITTPATFTGNINTGQLAGFRNKIINGAMEISQRGTSFAAAANGAYTLDRYVYSNSTGGVVTITQDTASVPSTNEFQYALKVAVTTADTTILTGDYCDVGHKIEGYNVRDLIGKTFTLSFWVSSSKTGTHCVSFRNAGFDRSYVTEYTINSANTWEYKSVTVTGGLITAGTWLWTNGMGLFVDFCLAMGSTFYTTANAWQTGNFNATSNQVNCLDAIGNVFALTGVQLEVGNTATPFEHRPYGTELALCQRYYEKTYSQSVTPGSIEGSTAVFDGVGASGNAWRTGYTYKITKRAAPTITTYSPTTGASGKADIIGVAQTYNITTPTDSQFNGFGAGSASGNYYVAYHWVAVAEI